MKNPSYKHHYLVECEQCNRVIGFYHDWHRDNQESLEKPPGLICPACFVKDITQDEKFWKEVISTRAATKVEGKVQ